MISASRAPVHTKNFPSEMIAEPPSKRAKVADAEVSNKLPSEKKEVPPYSLNEDKSLKLNFNQKFNGAVVEDAEFRCRLEAVVAGEKYYVDFTKYSYDMLLDNKKTIVDLYGKQLEAIIFQHMEVQVFLKKDYENVPGFHIHFQDRRRVTVSMDLKTFDNLLKKKEAVKSEHDAFKVKLTKLSKKSKIAAIAIAGK